MKKKSVLIISSLMAFMLIVKGLYINFEKVTLKKQQNAKNSTVATEENLQTVITTASLIGYNSVESLGNKSTLIVEGEIIGLDYFYFDPNTFTKAKLKVTNSFTNEVKVDDVIIFVDAGGITTLDKLKLKDGYEGKPGAVSPVVQKDKTTRVQVLFNGSPLLKLNDKIVLFGAEDKEDFYKLSERYYDPIGLYQGRFKITDNIVERYNETPSNAIESLKMTKTDLEEKIKKIKK